MAEIIGVRFKEVGKIYYFDPNGGNFRIGAPVEYDPDASLKEQEQRLLDGIAAGI